MKLATFNIYWLGNEQFVEKSGLAARTDVDWSLIAQVVAKLDADLLVFQEIVSPVELQTVLSRADTLIGRHYQIYDQDGQLLGTGQGQAQKVVVAYDAQQYDLAAASPLWGSPGRDPFGLRLRSRTSGASLLVVGVHFKSGQPQFDDTASAATRKQQCQYLADWVAGHKAAVNPVLPQPGSDEAVAILGDFNALYALEPHQPQAWRVVVDSLAPLRTDHMQEWWWEKPLADPAASDDRTTSYVEHLLIDFVMLSPALKERIRQYPTIYAFDQDAELTDNFTRPVQYRVSDHRPVYVELDL